MAELPLVGRARELALLAGAIDLARTGTTVFVELTGEPGIGKTRLLDELIARAGGFAVARGASAEFISDQPYGPFVRALGAQPVPGDRLMTERFRAHRVFCALMEARPGGLIVALDDFQWADDASYELLAHVLRQPRKGPLIIAVAYRSGQLAATFTTSQNHHINIEVGPLTPAEVRELGGTGEHGNPFFLQPGSRLDLRDPAETLMAHALAVVGDGAGPQQAAEVAQLPMTAALVALDGLVGRDLVRNAGASSLFAFRHPLLREAAYTAADPEWRAKAHARAAAWLRSRGASAVEQAPHLERSAVPGNAATLVEAAQIALADAPATAARWIEAALALLPAAPELRYTLARALYVQGRLQESRAQLRLLLPDLQPGPDRGSALYLCITIDQMLGDRESAMNLLTAELVEAPPDAAARLRLSLAMVSADGGQSAAALLWATQALNRHPSRLYQAGAHAVLAVTHGHSGADALGGWHAAKCADLLDGLLDGELAEALEVVIWAAWAEVHVERYADAVRHLTRAIPLARQTGQNEVLQSFMSALASAQVWTGQLDAAWENATDALEIAELMRSDELVAAALIRQSQIAALRGDHERAVGLGERAVAAASVDDELWKPVCLGLLGFATLSAGDPERAIALILDGGGGPGLPMLSGSQHPVWYDLLTQAELALGRVDAAAEWAARAQESAATLCVPSRYGYALLAQARLLVAKGEPARAVDLAREAASRFAATGARMYEGQARLLAGELSRARDLFEACGSPRFRELALTELRRIGARRARGSADSVAFTVREREIAELVGQGMTNQQIAARLRLSVKTVETHLGKIFRKAGVTNRSGLVATLSRQRA